MKYSNLLLIILLVFSSCTRKTDQQLFQEGQDAQGKKDFLLAIEKYQELIDQHANSSHADSAQLLVALIYNNDLRDMERAVRAYQKVYTFFPQSTMAPTAMFLAGFIFNNELHKLDTAKLMYETFLQKYPEHELAASAKFEMESFGKDPMQFIPQELIVPETTKTTAVKEPPPAPKKKKH